MILVQLRELHILHLFFCLHFVTFLSNLFLLGNVYIIFLDLVYVHNDVFTTFDSRAEHGPSK